MDGICPACGDIDALEHWNQGIYECRECGNMIDEDILEEMHDFDLIKEEF